MFKPHLHTNKLSQSAAFAMTIESVASVLVGTLEIVELRNRTGGMIQQVVCISTGKKDQISSFEFLDFFAKPQQGAAGDDDVKPGATVCKREKQAPWSSEIGAAVRDTGHPEEVERLSEW